MSGGLIYLIILYRTRNQNKLSISKNLEGRFSAVTQVYLEDQKIIKRRKMKEYISIFLISLIRIIYTIVYIVLFNFVSIIFDESLEIPIYFSFNTLFSIILLNSKLYRHQYFSLSIVAFCFIIFLIIDISEYSSEFLDILGTLSFYITTCGIFSFYLVFIKKHFETYSTNPYYLMFFIGLFYLILLVPIDLLVHFYDKEGEILGLDIINQIIILYDDHGFKFFCVFIFDMVIGFVMIGGVILTLYYFTPEHFIISLTFLHFLTKFNEWVGIENNGEDYDDWYKIVIYILLYGINIFLCLVYNEIIIIHLWSLEQNTSKYISLRERVEFEDSLAVYEENLTKKNSPIFDNSFDEE